MHFRKSQICSYRANPYDTHRRPTLSLEVSHQRRPCQLGHPSPLVNFLRRKHDPEGRACSHTVLPRPWRPSWRLPGWTVKLPGTSFACLPWGTGMSVTVASWKRVALLLSKERTLHWEGSDSKSHPYLIEVT